MKYALSTSLLVNAPNASYIRECALSHIEAMGVEMMGKGWIRACIGIYTKTKQCTFASKNTCVCFVGPNHMNHILKIKS